VLVLLLQGIYHCSGPFSFSVILLFFWLCASVLPLGHCVVAEAGCNWYRLDINIYSLSKKYGRPSVSGYLSTSTLVLSPTAAAEEQRNFWCGKNQRLKIRKNQIHIFDTSNF
jgi:hypothetical protein